MKIGIFAKTHGLNVSTVRYYIELGLLSPEKDKEYYNFTARDSADICTINMLKEAGFTLREMFPYMKIYRMYSADSKAAYQKEFEFFSNKKQQLFNQIAIMNKQLSFIDNKQIELTTKIRHFNGAPNNISDYDVTSQITVPLEFLNICACPECRSLLRLSNAIIEDGGIVSGKLTCSCGWQATIVNGIIITSEDNDLDLNSDFTFQYYGNSKPLDEYDCMYFDFFDDISPDVIQFFYDTGRWMDSLLNAKESKNRTFLFPDVAYIHMYQYSDAAYLKDSLLIFTALSRHCLLPIYRYLETLDIKLKAIFIVSPDCKLPLIDGAIDMVIDNSGTINYGFFKDSPYIDFIADYLDQDAEMIGSIACYQPDSPTFESIPKMYPNSIKPYYTLQRFKDSLSQHGFNSIQTTEYGRFNQPGGFFDYHSKNDFFTFYTYRASRNKE